jgi:ATP-dependent DNA ligase
MIATAVETVPAGPGWCYELKWDGWRVLAARRDDGTAALFSRAGRRLDPYLPDLRAVIARHLPGTPMLDGEIVVWANNRLSFLHLQQRLTAGRQLSQLAREFPVHYVAFDLLRTADGVDLTRRPLHERRQELERLLDAGPPTLAVCPQTTDLTEALRWVDQYSTAGIEGLVAKRIDSRYRPADHNAWRKIRVRNTTEAIVAGVTGSLQHPIRALLGRFDIHGHLRYVGRTTALTTVQATQLAPHLRRPPPQRNGAVAHPWPQPLPPTWAGAFRGADRAYLQVEPTTVAEIAVDTAYEQGRWRHPARLIRIRLDLSPYDIARIPPSNQPAA